MESNRECSRSSPQARDCGEGAVLASKTKNYSYYLTEDTVFPCMQFLTLSYDISCQRDKMYKWMCLKQSLAQSYAVFSITKGPNVWNRELGLWVWMRSDQLIHFYQKMLTESVLYTRHWVRPREPRNEGSSGAIIKSSWRGWSEKYITTHNCHRFASK